MYRLLKIIISLPIMIPWWILKYIIGFMFEFPSMVFNNDNLNDLTDDIKLFFKDHDEYMYINYTQYNGR